MLKRLNIYLKEMFPLQQTLIASFVTIYSFFIVQGIVFQKTVNLWDIKLIIPALTYLFFLLFLRVSDELKDQVSDKINFPNRPLPSGRVLAQDLRYLWWFIIFYLLIINMFLPEAWLWFAIIMLYGLLMYKYFFLAKYISKNILLALLSHNPVFFLLNIYVSAYLCAQFNIGIFSTENLLIVSLFYFPGLLWEVSRKIKIPGKENQYQTYSKKLGYKKTLAFVAIIISLLNLVFLALNSFLQIHLIALVLIQLSYIALLGFLIFVMFKPLKLVMRLLKLTESYIALLLGLTVLGFFLKTAF